MHAGLADPWNHPLIRLMQRCYHPLLAYDVDYEQLNAISNKAGGWPIARPEVEMGTHVVRELAVFNDEFVGEDVKLVWKACAGDQTGPVLVQGERCSSAHPPGRVHQTRGCLRGAVPTPGRGNARADGVQGRQGAVYRRAHAHPAWCAAGSGAFEVGEGPSRVRTLDHGRLRDLSCRAVKQGSGRSGNDVWRWQHGLTRRDVSCQLWLNSGEASMMVFTPRKTKDWAAA